MAWNSKYWDIIADLYWIPRYIGLQSITRDKWEIEGERVSIPGKLITNATGPLYFRSRGISETRMYLSSQEEILNHVFNLAFSIAGDEVISRLLCNPLGISDQGPFESIGREIGSRYGWREGENVTQQDGFFVTPSTLIAVELKLGSRSWPEQVAKYIALMLLEEKTSGVRSQLGLLFIVPETAMPGHWVSLGLRGPQIDEGFIGRLQRSKLPKKIRILFEQNLYEVREMLKRIRLALVSWTRFRNEIKRLEQKLDGTKVGDQTLQRLLAGLRVQIENHKKTGCGPR
jgi:hypothetical protein